MKLRGNNTYVKIINHNHNVLFCYRIKGHFHKLNLDKKFYIGGVPHIEKGLVVFDNFTGCIENMYLNHSSVSAGYLYPLKYDFQNILYDTIGNEVTKGKKHCCFWRYRIKYYLSYAILQNFSYEAKNLVKNSEVIFVVR